MTKAYKPKTDDDIRAALKDADGVRSVAAKVLGMTNRNLRKRLSKMDVDSYVPATQQLTGVSSLIDASTGEIKMQWIKSKEDVEAREALCQEVMDALKKRVKRIKPAPLPRKNLSDDLANLYVVTDFHLGMMAWGRETGADWTLELAEDLLIRWFDYAIKHAPSASHGVLAQLGDFLHYDSMEAVTPQHRHVLDASARPQDMIGVGIRVLRHVVNKLLRKHDTLYVLMAEGNHDPIASAWLRETFAVMYENEPRIQIETRPDPYYAHVWGQTVLFFHHGHLKTPEKVDDVFVRKFREEFGSSTIAYGHMGHRHSRKALETTLMEIEQHPTMAAADAYASRGGWVSERNAKVITYHKEHGEVGRIGITPEMVR